MKRLPTLQLVIAVMLALLLPIEQAHCAWMGLQKYAGRVSAASPAAHACCRVRPSGHQQTAPARQVCNCPRLPAVTLPTVIAFATAVPAVTSLATPAAPTVIAPVSIVTGTVLALDVGSRPLRDDPGAHGLRAPPASA